MTAVTDTPTATKPRREEDARHPLHRLAALFDENSLELLSPVDDSGMLAAAGTVFENAITASGVSKHSPGAISRQKFTGLMPCITRVRPC